MAIANYSKNKLDANLYIVCEGDVYTLDNAPTWLDENGWLSDWIFVAAENETKALAVANKFDSDCNARRGRIYTKHQRLQECRSTLMDKPEACTPQDILSSVNGCVFNQSYVLGFKNP